MLKAIIKVIDHPVAVDSFFYRLTNGGQAPGSLLYESQDAQAAYTGFSIGVYQPSLCISGKGTQFCYQALDERGECVLSQLEIPESATDLDVTASQITGTLIPDLSQTNLQARLSAVNHMQLVQALLLPIAVEPAYAHLPLGLFGGFAYDFIRQFEQVPRTERDDMQDDDYCFYLATRLFIVDYNTQQTFLISLIPVGSSDEAAQQDMTHMLKVMQPAQPIAFGSVRLGELVSDTDQATYLNHVEKLKKHIYLGDAFQVQYGRMLSAEFEGDAYKVYTTLKTLNPSPYMFYMRDHKGVLLGCSPELNIGVHKTKNGEREVALSPIAGTKPRGFRNGVICQEIDQRYAIALQTDAKELAEHVMLIDLVRNDIAAIAKTGTVLVTESFAVKKFSHVQHLVSRVVGMMKDNINALTAYLATMNMGTLTGAPKVKAMQLIAGYEKNEHGYFGGGFGFVTHDGQLETTIVIRSMRIKKGKVYLRAAAGIVADSVPESEWLETEMKMRACVRALEGAAKND